MQVLKHILVVMLMVLGCHSVKEKNQPAAAASKTLAGEWTVAELNGRTLQSSPLWIRVESTGAATGFGGVNQFNAALPGLDTGAFTLTDFTSTEKAGDPAARALEREFFTALKAARTFTASGDSAQLFDAAKPVITLSRRK